MYLSDESLWHSHTFVAPCTLGTFTVSVYISDRDVTSKWVPLISMALFTLSNTKHQRKNANVITYCEWALNWWFQIGSLFQRPSFHKTEASWISI